MRPDLFIHTIGLMRYGATGDELSEALHECVERARETGKQAELLLSIKIKPNGTSGQYELRDTLKTKLPELDKGSTLVFGTPEGNLTREDPQQRELDLRQVRDTTPTNFKELKK